MTLARLCGVFVGVMLLSLPAVAQDEPTNLASPNLLAVRYSEDLQGDRLVINVEFPYRELYLQGGPVPGLPAVGAPFIWTFPDVSVKLQNNTDDVLVLKTAIVEAVASAGGLDAPLLIWDDLSFAQLVIRNEGWIGVSNVSLDVDLAPVESCQGQGGPDLTGAAHHLTLPDFGDETKVPLMAYVPASLQNRDKVCAFGSIRYSDHDAAAATHAVRFKTRVFTRLHATASMPPSNFYQVLLHAERAHETVRVPLQQQLPPRSADHFVIVVGANRSARFSTTISVQSLTGKEVLRRRADIDVFVPRSEANRGRTQL
jgi:hypothetical protein